MLAELERIAAAFADLRPVIDPVREVVRMDCPACLAHESDPRGLYRPLEVVPRPGRLIHHCDACGRRDER